MSVADLCREYGISRPTAYRWINRYNETGPEGLVDRSRRPHSCSHATLEPIENAILALRARHPSWGARKLKARLEMLQPDVVWPAASTFGNILSRSGLTSPQRKRKRTTPCSEPFSLVTGPNQLWCMDFKGYFATADGKRCDPFTITDAYSRYFDSLPDCLAHGPEPSSSNLRGSHAGVRGASTDQDRPRRPLRAQGYWGCRNSHLAG
ncbi:helix-turn-helix domain-containing protein [Tunturiibacter gelidiferens]